MSTLTPSPSHPRLRACSWTEEPKLKLAVVSRGTWMLNVGGGGKQVRRVGCRADLSSPLISVFYPFLMLRPRPRHAPSPRSRSRLTTHAFPAFTPSPRFSSILGTATPPLPPTRILTRPSRTVITYISPRSYLSLAPLLFFFFLFLLLLTRSRACVYTHPNLVCTSFREEHTRLDLRPHVVSLVLVLPDPVVASSCFGGRFGSAPSLLRGLFLVSYYHESIRRTLIRCYDPHMPILLLSPPHPSRLPSLESRLVLSFLSFLEESQTPPYLCGRLAMNSTLPRKYLYAQ